MDGHKLEFLHPSVKKPLLSFGKEAFLLHPDLPATEAVPA